MLPLPSLVPRPSLSLASLVPFYPLLGLFPSDGTWISSARPRTSPKSSSESPARLVLSLALSGAPGGQFSRVLRKAGGNAAPRAQARTRQRHWRTPHPSFSLSLWHGMRRSDCFCQVSLVLLRHPTTTSSPGLFLVFKSSVFPPSFPPSLPSFPLSFPPRTMISTPAWTRSRATLNCWERQPSKTNFR